MKKKDIISFIILILVLVSMGRGIYTASQGKSNPRIIHSMTFGLFGMSEESELIRAGGYEAYAYIEFQKNLKRYKEKCIGKLETEFCISLSKKMEPYLLKN